MARHGLALGGLVLAVLAPGCALLSRSEGGGAAEEPLLSRVRQLTFEGARAGEGYFGPDGQRMVFQSERAPGNPFFQIYEIDLETGDERRVSPGTGKTTCAWIHPSDGRVLFASTHLDPEAGAKQERELELRVSGKHRRYSWDYDEHYDLFAADARGQLARLTSTRGYDAEGSYSPDGTLVAFASNRHAYAEELSEEDAALFERDPASMMELYRMRADGSDVRRLTHTRGYDGGPFFSPDGGRLVWRRFSEDGATAEIMTMDLDGGDVRRLTSLGVMSWAPFFHPSGEYVIFATNLHGFENFELYLVDAEGLRAPVRVTSSEGFDGLPAFSPDGARLSWTSARGRGRGSQVFLADWDHPRARAGLAGTRAAAAREAPPSPAKGGDIAASELRRHVEALAADAMEGRRTGTEGERLATEYVAQAFAAAGLEPAGAEGTWFQRFEFTAGVSLGDGNRLRAIGPDGERGFAVDADWRPLAFSRAGEGGPAPVVFAGYGIVAPEGDGVPAYDAYAGLEVKGKWVMVFRFLPEDVPPAVRQHMHRYASLRHKAMIARDRGALGLVVVSGPRSGVKHPLVPIRPDASIAATSLLAFSATDDLAASWLGPPLRELQKALDGGGAQPGFEIPDLRLAVRVDLVQERRAGRNVLGRLRAPGGRRAAPVLVGAHVDHLGRAAGGASLAGDEERGEIHPGADDNASGVAVLLEVARSLAARARTGAAPLFRDVLFAAWSGEELGLLGSNAFAADLPDVHAVARGAEREIAAYLNMDMVGRLHGSLLVYGAGSSDAWPGLIERSNAPVGLPIQPENDAYLPTDTTAFYLKGVPVLSPFTGVHAEYHTPRDTPDRLDYAGARDVARLVERLALRLARSETIPDYVAFERPEDVAPRAGLRAYLGTVPSYGETEGAGVALSGVAKGGPAEAAGVRAGDRIVELAGRRIENIYDYTYAIDALKIGDDVGIAVERDGERVELTITPASRH